MFLLRSRRGWSQEAVGIQSDTLDFDQQVRVWQLVYCNAGATWPRFRVKILIVRLIHPSIVLHVNQKDLQVHQVCKGGVGKGQSRLHLANTGTSLLFDVFVKDFSSHRVQGDTFVSSIDSPTGYPREVQHASCTAHVRIVGQSACHSFGDVSLPVGQFKGS